MARLSIGTVLALSAVAAAGTVFWLTIRDEPDPTGPAPLAVQADGPTFATLAALVAASDRVVEATVVGFDDGRTITDPNDSTSGVRTRLVQLDVVETFAGAAATSVVMEEEAALVDGTPIIVNGAEPVTLGASGFFFLVEGATDEFPYVAAINEQGRYLVDDVASGGLIAASPSSSLARAVEEMGIDALRVALRGG